jgi:hypothetical protein
LIIKLITTKKWLLIFVCLQTFIRIDQIVATYHFICISDYKIDVNALVKWGLLQVECGWNEGLYFPCNCGNEIYQLIDGLFEEKNTTLKL